MQLKSEILNKVSTLKNLPTLPHILIKLIEVCNQEDADVAEISRIVETDPALSGKILKLINSAYYGLPKKIESVHHCVCFLGTSTLKNIAIGSSISQAFLPSGFGSLFNQKVFWWHSLRCAVLSRQIARKTKYSNPEEAFLTGLLHDIGRIVLWINYPKEYSELLDKCEGRSDLIIAGEIRQGVTHCEIGAWLLHRWKLHSFVVDAVLYHHESLEKIRGALPLVQIVYAANALSQNLAQKGNRDLAAGISQELFGFTSSQIDELLTQAETEVGEVARLLEIEIEAPRDPEGPVSKKDQEQRAELNRQAEDFSLLLATLQSLMEVQDEDAILKVVQQGIHILFDVNDVLFFLYDQEKDSLLGKGVNGNERSEMINDLVVSMKTEGSLLVRCLQQKEPLTSFVDSPLQGAVIVDQQIVRFLGMEGMFCLPMLVHGSYVGVIVLGLDQVEFSHLSKKLNLITLFSKQAGMSLHAEQMKRAPLLKIQNERAVASSDIARKVVHEVNNPLSIIKNYLKVLGLKLAKQNIAQDEILILNKEIDRISHLLRALTSFSESRRRKTGPVDINAVLSDLVKITKESLRKHSGIEVRMDLKYSLPIITSEEDSIKQVFVNLIKNAAEAMTEGGNIFIKTRHISNRIEGEGEGEPASEGAESQGFVEVVIKDDGPGIPEEIRSSLFDPFVSTKNGNHSGLGLSIVHNIIKSLNGRLICESEKGKGTCFRIELPIAFQE